MGTGKKSYLMEEIEKIESLLRIKIWKGRIKIKKNKKNVRVKN